MSNQTETELAVTPIQKTPWYALPVIFGCMLLVSFFATRIQIVMTESVNATVVWPSEKIPEQGDFVTFKLIHRVIPTPDNSVQVTKILSCSENQILRRVENIWTCDGVEIGTSRKFAQNGDKLEQFEFNGVIPKGKAFVTGTHEHSFDSRYWGFVDASKLRTVYKVF
ncbi:S26 family signal peptidase [Thalassotalea marina]|uniref:Conjugal transfer protein TraF n=1 Tax=Thalassotalea marina TaxID=1673741 RepID=A0A919BR92_9GAMM|nr:S26 family signal peptidase [Thalassotalea marina]GHG07114.1 conjugal transfer protein TraF [Thalassotalea marina]